MRSKRTWSGILALGLGLALVGSASTAGAGEDQECSARASPVPTTADVARCASSRWDELPSHANPDGRRETLSRWKPAGRKPWGYILRMGIEADGCDRGGADCIRGGLEAALAQWEKPRARDVAGAA